MRPTARTSERPKHAVRIHVPSRTATATARVGAKITTASALAAPIAGLWVVSREPAGTPFGPLHICAPALALIRGRATCLKAAARVAPAATGYATPTTAEGIALVV